MTIQTYSNSQLFSTFREESKWGRDWLIVKGVPIVEGVLKNYFVPVSEFGAFAHDWNDVPLVLRHPMENGGTAKTPNVDVPVIGRFYNAMVDQDGRRLTGEFWLDKDALAATEDGRKILNAVKHNKKIEVSTGYHAQIDNIAGEYGSRHYVGIHRNLHPDHIAILPDVPGACSIQDGCGLNRNDSVICNSCPCKGGSMTIENAVIHLKSNGKSLDERINAIRDAFMKVNPSEPALKAEAPGVPTGWIREVFDSHVIVESGGKMYRANYTADGDTVTFAPFMEWTPVKIEHKYVDVSNMTGNLPAEGKKLYEKVYKAAIEAGDDEETASKKAWGACKKAGWKKQGDEWVNNATKRFYDYNRIPDEAKKLFDKHFHDAMREAATKEEANTYAFRMCKKAGWHMDDDGRWEKRDGGKVIGGNSMRAKAKGKTTPVRNAEALVTTFAKLGIEAIVINGGRGSGNFGHKGGQGGKGNPGGSSGGRRYHVMPGKDITHKSPAYKNAPKKFKDTNDAIEFAKSSKLRLAYSHVTYPVTKMRQLLDDDNAKIFTLHDPAGRTVAVLRREKAGFSVTWE